MVDFLSMDGYAGYVWPAYGITLAILVGMSVWARRRRLAALERARQRAHEQTSGKQPTVRQL